MKNYLRLGLLFLAVSLYSCGGGGEAESAKEEKVLVNPNNPNNPNKTASSDVEKTEAEEVPASKRVDLVNKGVGPIKSVTIPETIDQELAAKGLEVYEKNCTACHKPNKKHIGPAPKDILDRRTPEWVMNMIINPDIMVQEDALAKDLLIEFNGSPMSNQGISEDDARAILEYIRTL
ncbi:cytochrome c [Brumimicrobium glaciale]|uniref:Cytochrome c n=1 Tax=Brumimicrobium glaciale TaxID=200475 RepID=A0A4Q4KQ89_9FLAO|nr:cytochrome c [Brumimicrobium glaciale]RYM35047.1 cytochrome c [Brumimicrobium glaciale]